MQFNRVSALSRGDGGMGDPTFKSCASGRMRGGCTVSHASGPSGDFGYCSQTNNYSPNGKFWYYTLTNTYSLQSELISGIEVWHLFGSLSIKLGLITGCTLGSGFWVGVEYFISVAHSTFNADSESVVRFQIGPREVPQMTQGSAVSKASWTSGFFILFFSKRTLNLQCHVDTGQCSSLTVIE